MNEIPEEWGRKPQRLDDSPVMFRVVFAKASYEGSEVSRVPFEHEIVAHGR